MNVCDDARTPAGSGDASAVALEVRGLRSELIERFDAVVRKGEVVGVIGLIGSGREELVYALSGAIPARTEHIWCCGTTLETLTPRRCRRVGIALVPGYRQQGSLVERFTVAENITLPGLGLLRDPVFGLRRRREAEVTRTWMDKLGIKATSEHQPVDELSGGNKQKAILAKWLHTDPDVMLLDEPTAGVDFGGMAEIHRIVRGAARERGMAVLFTSSDLADVRGMADRVLVMRERVLAADRPAADGSPTEHELVQLMGGLS